MKGGALARLVRASADRTAAAESSRATCAPRRCPTNTPTCTTPGSRRCAASAVLLGAVRTGRAGDGRHRLVPRRRVRLPRVDTDVLGVPVGLVFFVPRADGTVTAEGPSPAGAMRWEVDAAAWQQLAAACPQLAGVEPEVEALLVNTVHGLDHHWIVPIDDCYRMVAAVRREWRGLSGGGRVWPAVERFFEDLTERS